MYWNQKEDNNVVSFITGDSRVQTYAYNKLLPRMRELTQQIMNKYFSIPQSRYMEIRDDCIQNIFLEVHKADRSSGKSLFWYISFVAKNYLIDLEKIKKYRKTIQYDYEEDFDGYTDVVHDKLELDTEAVLSHLRQLRHQVSTNTPKTRNYENTASVKLRKANMCLVLDLIMEYVEKYDDIDIKAVYEYVVHNSDLVPSTITTYFRKMFNVHPKLQKPDTDATRRLHAISIINDDHVPITAEEHGKKYKYHKKHKMQHVVNPRHIYF